MKRKRHVDQLQVNFQSRENERDRDFRARPRPRSPLTRPRSKYKKKQGKHYEPHVLEQISVGMCLSLIRETERVRICSDRIERVICNPSRSVLWNGDGRSPLHLGVEQFDVLVPSNGNPFKFNIDDTFVKLADPRDMYSTDGDEIVKKKITSSSSSCVSLS